MLGFDDIGCIVYAGAVAVTVLVIVTCQGIIAVIMPVVIMSVVIMSVVLMPVRMLVAVLLNCGRHYCLRKEIKALSVPPVSTIHCEHSYRQN